MDYAVLECEPHMVDVIDDLLPPGVHSWPGENGGVVVAGDPSLIPATVVRLHTTLSKSGKRRCKLVPA